jgi:LemA protein
MNPGIAILVVGAIGLLVLALLIVAVGVGIYNGLVRSRNEARNAWSQIDVQLKRRHDLIPNLVETVRGYATHERQTLENVIAARNQAAGATDLDQRIKAEAGLSGALSRLMVVAEQYPELKANQNFLALQEELTSTENKISFSRQYYNDASTQYNNKLQVFPSNLIAGSFHFQPAPLFEVSDQAEREAPKVKF